jgi:hypothetical protein
MKCALAAVVGAILLFGLARSQEGWEVSGTVTTGSGPVKDAVIEISGASSLPSARTDGQGRYALKGVVPGRYSIAVQKKDNTSAPPSRSVTLTSGMRLRVDFRIPKGAIISGRVLDSDKQPVSGVIVQALSKTIGDGRLRLNEQGGDMTNDLGEYRMPYLPDGTYVVAVTPKPLTLRHRASASGAAPGSGYPPITFYPGTRILGAAAVLEIRSGDERPGVDITLQKEPTWCLSFKIGSAFGDSRAAVELEERTDAQNSPSTLAQGTGTANGSYQICGVAPGEYRLHLYSYITDQLRRLHLQGYRTAAAVVEKENVDLGPLEPFAQEDIRGNVTVKDAAPGSTVPAGIRVRIVAWEMRSLFTDTRPGLVQPDGTFVLSQVFTGDYGIRVDTLPAGYYLMSATQQGNSVLERGLRPGNGDVRIMLGADGPIVSGRVLADDGAAVPDASVLLVPKDSGRHLAAQSDQAGAYQFITGIRPGKYRLAAVSDLPGWKRQDAAAAASLAAGGMDLELGPRQSRTVDLKIQSTR